MNTIFDKVLFVVMSFSGVASLVILAMGANAPMSPWFIATMLMTAVSMLIMAVRSRRNCEEDKNEDEGNDDEEEVVQV